MNNSSITADGKNLFWNNLYVRYCNGYWVTADIIESEKALEDVGIPSLHTYTVKGVFQNAQEDKPIQLIRLIAILKKISGKEFGENQLRNGRGI